MIIYKKFFTGILHTYFSYTYFLDVLLADLQQTCRISLIFGKTKKIISVVQISKSEFSKTQY